MMARAQSARGSMAAIALATLAALPCAQAQSSEGSFADMISKVTLLPQGAADSEMLAKATQAVEFIRKMDLPRAQSAINEALQLDARNSYLHFLNGFVYHLQARQGDTQKNEMAIEGYRQAVRLDPSNWIAQEFLGLAYMDLKQFEHAKLQFSDVLLMTPESSISLYGLMVASYLTGDAATACTMADQFRAAVPKLDAAFVRSSVSVYASCGNFEQAERMRQAFNEIGGAAVEAERMDRRLAQWKSFYRQRQADAGFVKASVSAESASASMQLAQAFTAPSLGSRPSVQAPAATEPTDASSTSAPTPAPAPTPADAPVDTNSSSNGNPRMVLIDVVLLSTQEILSTSKGVNLLNALTLQLGSSTTPAYSHVSSSTLHNGALDANTVITRAVTIPALAYSLNIANANSSTNEVLARPTLAAIEGLPSEFFSGTNLSAGVVSTSTQGGTTVVPLDKRFGIKLAVTPRFLPKGQVQIKVDAQRTSLNANSDNPKVAYQIEIAEIIANANVVMNLGDTLVLSGLSEKSSSSTRDGVPGLQDVPLVQYLFSNKKTNDIQRSVLILVTPRLAGPVAEADKSARNNSTERMKALREKFGLPANIPSNVEAIMSQLKPSELFREFRQGDVTLERWERLRSTGERLKEALALLYS